MEIVKAFGDPNILASEGEVHKRQRRAIAPAFRYATDSNSVHDALTSACSDRNLELVWEEATRVVGELVKTDAWAGGKSVSIPHIVDLTEKARRSS